MDGPLLTFPDGALQRGRHVDGDRRRRDEGAGSALIHPPAEIGLGGADRGERDDGIGAGPEIGDARAAVAASSSPVQATTGSFMNAPSLSKLARAVRRGLQNMRIQAFLTAAAINLKRLAAALALLLLADVLARPRRSIAVATSSSPFAALQSRAT